MRRTAMTHQAEARPFPPWSVDVVPVGSELDHQMVNSIMSVTSLRITFVTLACASVALAGCSFAPTSTTDAPSRSKLDKVLTQYGLPNPTCDVTDARYTVSNDWKEYLGATFSAPTACIQTFVKTLTKDPLVTQSIDWPNDDTFTTTVGDTTETTVGFLPIDPDYLNTLGWNLDRSKTYDMYLGDPVTEDDPDLTVLVNYAAHSGTVHAFSELSFH
jgi:hypothetical protein